MAALRGHYRPDHHKRLDAADGWREFDDAEGARADAGDGQVDDDAVHDRPADVRQQMRQHQACGALVGASNSEELFAEPAP